MSQLHQQDLLIPSSFGRSMAADLTYKPGTKKLALYIHGINGFKDWGGMNLVAEAFAKEGIAFLKINLSHNGTTPDDKQEFVDMEAYGKDNYSIRQNDLKQALIFSYSDAIPLEVEEVVLIGHSRGGVDAMIYAAHERNVDKLITWSAPSNAQTPWSKWSNSKLKQWKSEGVVFLKNGRTGQDLPLYYQLKEDYKINRERYDPMFIASKIDIPWLIVHGASDEAVEVEQARVLSGFQPNARLELIEDTGHTYGRKHPWTDETLPEATLQLIETTKSFIL